MLHQFINIRPFAFDADDMTPCPFQAHIAHMVTFSHHEPCGTDCIVAYVFSSREEVEKLLYPFAGTSLPGWLEAMDPDSFSLSEDEQKAVDKLCEKGYVLLSFEEKAVMRPTDKDSATALMNAALNDMGDVRPPVGASSESRHWFYHTNLPHRQQQLGAVMMNCHDFLKKHKG
jgi:hypothetical protein